MLRLIRGIFILPIMQMAPLAERAWMAAAPRKNFIVGTSDADAIVARSNYLYWINGELNSIARAGINGDNVNQNFLTDSDLPGFIPAAWWRRSRD